MDSTRRCAPYEITIERAEHLGKFAQAAVLAQSGSNFGRGMPFTPWVKPVLTFVPLPWIVFEVSIERREGPLKCRI
jgi:hypothetical protein